MAANYLRSWFPPAVPQITTHEAEDDDDITITGDYDEDDTPAAFPALNSAQRAAPTILTDAQLMPPPPMPRRQVGAPVPTSSLGSTLALPPSTLQAPLKQSNKREKVALAPGHGALDWANLKSSGQDLRVRLYSLTRYGCLTFVQGVESLMRIPPSELKKHRRRDDMWTAIYGKVYNITAYLPFHPGGEKELMRCAGRDGTKLFGVSKCRLDLLY